MQSRSASRFLIISLGIALLLAGLFFDGSAASIDHRQINPTATASFMQRLAEPTLPSAALQADYGAQDYWLYCLPCHGDRGQGLTDEFRQTYPPEETNCWVSGCHGKRPYEDGFTLPETIPPVIGPGTLDKFPDAAVLRSYIYAAMPYWNPGSLTEEQTWRITAFLLRENGLWDGGRDLDESNAGGIVVSPPQATPTPQPYFEVPPEPFMWLFIGFSILLAFLFLLRAFRKK